MIPGVASRNRIRTGDFRGAWGDVARLEIPAKSAVITESQGEAALAVSAFVSGEIELLLTSSARVDAQTQQDLLADGFTVVRELGSGTPVMDHPHVVKPPSPGSIWLLTSGSTGRPKRVRHSLSSLTTVRAQQPGRTWLCAYAPGSYAWWQVVTLGLYHPNTQITFIEPDELDRWPAIAWSTGVTAASGTPTFWRHSIMRDSAALASLHMGQVTVGGEPVDQRLLDTLRELFPEARVSWIYASSEAGAAIAVHDGIAGFPIEWIGRDSPERPRILVRDGELVISSPFASAGNDVELRTGDLVEVSEGRVRIVGRLNADEVNVGGIKVSASAVRDALLSYPGIVWASVRGRAAPVVGQVVVADIVASEPLDMAALRNWCTRRLGETAVPRRIRVLDEIPLRESLKSDV